MSDYSNMTDEELLKLYQEKKYEVARYDAMQQGFKIALNSLYGAQANQYFRYFDTDVAEGITLTGQLIIQYISKELNQFFNTSFKTDGVEYIVAGDTDSVYIRLDKFVELIGAKDETDYHKVTDILNKFCETKIEPFIAKKYAELTSNLQCAVNKIHMKREAISIAAIWRAKKNYCLFILDNEHVRYNEPHFKAVGVEIARSSTPKVVRNKLTEAIKLVMLGTEVEVQEFVENFRQEFESMPVDDISFPRGVKDIEKWETPGPVRWRKGAPMHVKAAITFNDAIKKNKLDKTVSLIRSKDKIKFIHIKEPNPFGNNTIGYIDYLPADLGVMEFIDYETQFQKTFFGPLKSFTDIVGWDAVKIANLKSIFG